MRPIFEILLKSGILVGKLSSAIGIGIGLLIFFAPKMMQRIEDKMTIELVTNPAIRRLNKCYENIDTVILRYPIIFGLSGIIAGMELICISVVFLGKSST